MSLMGLCAIQAGVMVAGLDTGSLRLGGALGIHGFAGCTQDIARLVAVAYGVSFHAAPSSKRAGLDTGSRDRPVHTGSSEGFTW